MNLIYLLYNFPILLYNYIQLFISQLIRLPWRNFLHCVDAAHSPRSVPKPASEPVPACSLPVCVARRSEPLSLGPSFPLPEPSNLLGLSRLFISPSVRVACLHFAARNLRRESNEIVRRVGGRAERHGRRGCSFLLRFAWHLFISLNLPSSRLPPSLCAFFAVVAVRSPAWVRSFKRRKQGDRTATGNLRDRPAARSLRGESKEIGRTISGEGTVVCVGMLDAWLGL